MRVPATHPTAGALRAVEAPLPGDASFLDIDDNSLVSYGNVSRDKAEEYRSKAGGGT